MGIRHLAGLTALVVCVAAGVVLPGRHATTETLGEPTLAADDSNKSLGMAAAPHAAPTWVPLAGEVMVNIHELPEAAKRIEPWRLRYYCPADFNKDNHLDSSDATLFLAVYAVREGPMVPWLDINQDGDVNEADLTAFFQSLQDGGCDPMHQAEVRGLIC